MTRRALALVLLLLLAAAGCVVAGLRDTRRVAHASTPSATPATTPMLSARRTPALVVDQVATTRLQQQLATTTAGVSACYDVVSDAGAPLASAGAEQPLAPASTQKLLTATAALTVFGPQYRYTTNVVAAAKPDDGVVERVWLVGSGDPVLSTPAYQTYLAGQALTRGDVTTPLAQLADGLVAAGVRAIPGGILGDDHLFDTDRSVPSWPARYLADGNVGPLGALTVDDGLAAPRFAQTTDPAVNAAAQLSALLVARGVAVGPAGRGNAPASATTLASVTSPTLHDIVTSMLSSSDNNTAELLTRLLGTRVATPGTTQAGTTVIAAQLTKLGVDTTGLHLVDGSGLSRDDRTTCTTLLQVLRLASTRPDLRALTDGLPVAAQRGTLATVFQRTPLAGKLHAKTGSLDGVTGLVGDLDVHDPLEFAFLANGSFPESSGITLRERVAGVLATYPDAPSPSALVPGP
ncbi:MAG TPA: D-alanyl-D-alanine carboxypeptidase/D-alanyl-D-alanine-endopeptidase [Acidimicrobiia bacterium]|nr:D-alanyl-D-alanine carboxypeptidase/D-alanyl-D-alanine-endopeptidase [Acidimicrobiia bacterium]